MPDHKLQHFVPRCYFKPFSLNEEGKAISLFNIPKKQFVTKAPLRGQCAGSYFYGKDLRREKAFQSIEGKYAEAIKALQEIPLRVSDDQIRVLRDFLQLQHYRTEAALKRLETLRAGLADAVFSSKGEQTEHGVDLSHEALIGDLMKQFLATQGHLDDLSACIVSNDTGEQFLTSDDPVVLTNRFYLQRLNSSAFGIASTGVVFLMPLTPRLCLLLWDRDCYSIPDCSGQVLIVKRADDVRAINGFQYQRAVSNIYVAANDQDESVAQACEALGERLPSFRLYTMIENESGGERERSFKAVDPIAAKQRGSFMVLFQPNYPKPTAWPSFLKWRFKIKSHNDGSAVGHVRLNHPALTRRNHERSASQVESPDLQEYAAK